MKKNIGLGFLVLWLGWPLAQASNTQVRCTDKGGKTVITNVVNNYAALTDDCDAQTALLSEAPPAKKMRLARASEEPIRRPALLVQRDDLATEARFTSAALKPVSLNEFRVAPELQKKRDLGRQQLLALELASEQKKFAEVKALIPNPPKAEHNTLLVLAHRHLNNIASLKRELGIANTPR